MGHRGFLAVSCPTLADWFKLRGTLRETYEQGRMVFGGVVEGAAGG